MPKEKLPYFCCVDCGEGVMNKGGQERVAAKVCAECWQVRTRRKKNGKLLTCMNCDERAVLTERYAECKPCRVKRLPPPRIKHVRGKNRISDDGDPSWEGAMRRMEG